MNIAVVSKQLSLTLTLRLYIILANFHGGGNWLRLLLDVLHIYLHVTGLLVENDQTRLREGHWHNHLSAFHPAPQSVETLQ